MATRASEFSWKSGIGDLVTTDADQSSSGLGSRSESLSLSDGQLPSDIVPALVLLRFNLANWHNYNEKEREQRLKGMDALELLDTVKSVEGKLASLRTENLTMVNFLEKNDAKLLLGYAKTREMRQEDVGMKTLNVGRSVTGRSITGRSITGRSTINRSSTGRSMMGRSLMGLSTNSRRPNELCINYQAKREMAEKFLIEVEKRCKLAEKEGKNKMKVLRVKIDELGLRNQESIETKTNFKVHFDLSSQLTEQQLYAKLRRFIDNWLTNANTLIGNMRLEIQNLDSSCNEYNLQIIAKSELRRMLTGADFEQLRIQRKELRSQLVLKEQHATELKQNFGKATVKLVGQKSALLNDEKENKQLLHRIEVLQHLTDGVEREIDALNKENEQEKERMEKLKKNLQNVKAPSIADYMNLKESIAKLEKDIKIEKRKINLLNIH